MPRIPPLEYADAGPETRALYDQQIASHGRVTNMKRTLGRSPVALRALMTWYDLHAEVKQFLGERGTTLFCHAISSKADCLICSTFFRRLLIEAGENPDALTLDVDQAAVVEYGRQLATDPNNVSDDLYERLLLHFDERQIVALTAFGGMMIATNVFNNALQVDLDEYLFPFRKK